MECLLHAKLVLMLTRMILSASLSCEHHYTLLTGRETKKFFEMDNAGSKDILMWRSSDTCG